MSFFSSIFQTIASAAAKTLVPAPAAGPDVAEKTPGTPSQPAEKDVPSGADAREPVLPPPAPAGRIYYQYKRTQYADEDELRDNTEEWLKTEIASKRGRIVLDGGDQADPLAAVERILLGDGAERSFFLSNCSTGGTRICPWVARGRCPLEDESDCCLANLPCNMVMIRPKRDLPSIGRMFPGNEILAVRALLYDCPADAGGCVAAIDSFVWAPICEARSFEREIRASFVPRDMVSRNPELHGRPGNLLKADILSGLPPISIETAKNLATWRDYLDWRNRLVAENTRAVRYFRAQVNADGSASIFAVHDNAADAPGVSWLRREELEAVPLAASEDPWTFREPGSGNFPARWSVRATLLGEAESVKPLAEAPAAMPEGCPWDSRGFLEVRIPTPDEEGNGGRQVEIPEEGFLRICQRGDRSLIERMKKTLDEFARNGSVAAPFLSSYLFDIPQARLPVRNTPIDAFLAPNLNEDQKRAVQIMLDAPDIALVQGPPGTGKTTVIAEAIWQFVRAGKTVLLASQSIAAVENALDRLAHVPEIRVQLLRKKTQSGAPAAENDPYSEADLLREYYAALGRKARETVSVFDQAEGRRKTLLDAAAKLEPLVRRMEEESAVAATAAAQAGKAGEAVRAAEIRAEAAVASRRAREAAERLLSLLPALAPAEIGDWARDLPASVVSPLADAIRTAADAFAEQGIRLWSDFGEDEPHRPPDIRLRTLAGAAERLRLLRDKGLPALLQCIERWHVTTGERLVDDESARTIQELTLRLREAERLRDEADDAGNDEAYRRHDAEARQIRRQIREAKAAAKTSIAEFREWFSLPRGDGRTLAGAIEAADGNRAAILELVAGFEAFAKECLEAIPRGERKVAGLLRERIDALSGDDGAGEALRRARQILREAEPLVREAQERYGTFENQAAPMLERLRSAEPGVPAEPVAALAWCKDAAGEIERRTKAEREAHPWAEPLFREWSELTAAPNDGDRERVLPLYLENCNVIGTTCTANPRLLGDWRFDVVIVDEVSKATPPELLAPMMRGAKTILVGDHRQLPPLFDEKEPLSMEEIASREEEDDSIPEERKIIRRNFRKYKDMVEASLFKRHFERADPRLKSSLLVQYRMHPDIMSVINVFYEGKLKCGLPEGEADRLRDHGQSGERVPWMSGGRHAYWIDSTSAPDGTFSPDEPAGTSRVNGLEVRLVLRALQDLDAGLEGKTGPDGRPPAKTVGVIAFYGKQKGLLSREIRKLRFRHLKCKVETVDRFQGQERDYVLVSMTRNSLSQKAGTRAITARFERINVAFSRAREILLVFGARDFFNRQPVLLPALDGNGRPKKTAVYEQIADMLARRGALLRAEDIIPAPEWTTLPPLPTGAKPPSGAPGWRTGPGRFPPKRGSRDDWGRKQRAPFHGNRRPPHWRGGRLSNDEI